MEWKFEPSFYFKKDSTPQLLNFILMTQVGNYTYCSSFDTMNLFETFLKKKFDIGKLGRH